MSPKRRRAKDKNRRKKSAAFLYSKYEMYQRAVQEPEADIEFVNDLFGARFGRRPETLREDFCGAAFLACEWVAFDAANRAWGVDLDPEPLAWGLAHNAAEFDDEQLRRLTLIEGDVLTTQHQPVDVIAAFNFSYYCFKTRTELLAYFAAAFENLGAEGLFALDIYGGPEAQELVEETTEHDDFGYVWDQDEFDPIQSRMVCHIHFEDASGKRMKRAFSYDWRLWTILELREAMLEVGFASTEVHWEGVDEESEEGDGVFEMLETAENTESWIAYVIGVKR